MFVWELLDRVIEIGLLVFLLVGLFFSPYLPKHNLINAVRGIIGIFLIICLLKLIIQLIDKVQQENTEELLEEAWEKANLKDNFLIWNWAEKCGYVSAQLKQNKKGYWIRLKRKTGQVTPVTVDPSVWIKPFAEAIAFVLSVWGMFFLLLEKGNVSNLIISLLLFLLAYFLIRQATCINELILSFALYFMCKGRINLLCNKLYSFYDLGVVDILFSTVSLRPQKKELEEFEMSLRSKENSRIYSFIVLRSELKSYLKFR